jgi:uncharacterized membrane protein SpoIIM required for sporulation
MHQSLFTAWKKLLLAYFISAAAGMVFGTVLLNLIKIAPETIFEISTKRLSYALPVISMGTQAGLDTGISIFLWNGVGALATISFIFTATLFNPFNIGRSPRVIRNLFCSPPRMKLLCFLPGCMKIEQEPLRRLYVWLMIPLISMILLGIETGLSVSTTQKIFGSYLTGITSLVPHGIIEIPAFALAGAVTFSGHLVIKPKISNNPIPKIFQELKSHRQRMPITKVSLAVIFCLLLAGVIEAHVTQALIGK